MMSFILRRLVLLICVVAAVSVITFLLLRATGDPAVAMAGEGATAADVDYVRKQYGFDRPLPAQFLTWSVNALRGDLGVSKFLQQPVSEIILERLPTTLMLGLAALLIAIVIAVPLGVVAAVRQDEPIDHFATFFALVGQALPTFWFALILMAVFGAKLRWVPISGDETWRHFILPAIALAFYATPSLMRLTRSGMLDVLGSDYIRTARAKGLSPAKVVFKHALRNAMLPIVSLAAVQLGFMLGGSVVIETIFSINGLGNLAWQSIKRADIEVMQAVVLMLSLIFIGLTFLADILNTLLDPRIRVR
jgi:peptide/nickel transport system permease protein